MSKDVGTTFIALAPPAIQIGDFRFKGDKTAVAADARVLAVVIPLLAAAVDRDLLCRSRLSVMDKDVGSIIAIPADKIGGVGLKGDKTAVAADARVLAVVIPLNSAAVNRDPLCHARLSIMDKDVRFVIAVPTN